MLCGTLLFVNRHLLPCALEERWPNGKVHLLNAKDLIPSVYTEIIALKSVHVYMSPTMLSQDSYSKQRDRTE